MDVRNQGPDLSRESIGVAATGSISSLPGRVQEFRSSSVRAERDCQVLKPAGKGVLIDLRKDASAEAIRREVDRI